MPPPQDEARALAADARAREGQGARVLQGMMVAGFQHMQHMGYAFVGPHRQGGDNFPQLPGPGLDDEDA